MVLEGKEAMVYGQLCFCLLMLTQTRQFNPSKKNNFPFIIAYERKKNSFFFSFYNHAKTHKCYLTGQENGLPGLKNCRRCHLKSNKVTVNNEVIVERCLHCFAPTSSRLSYSCCGYRESRCLLVVRKAINQLYQKRK